MKNRRYYYLAEGECEKEILDALKQTPPLIHPGKTDTFNVIQDELKPRQLMNFAPGSCVVLVFDTDKDETEHLKKNIELLQSLSFKVEILTIMQVLNFEDEIERATDVKSALDLTKSASLKDFKNAVNRAKEKDFRSTLHRHKLDMTKLWAQKPPKTFGFIKQDAEKIKI